MLSKDDTSFRSKFKFGINKNNESIIEAFDQAKYIQSEFNITCIGKHVFIRFSDKNEHFWSPHLHLEVNKIERNTTLISGFTNPNPIIWCAFISLHVIILILFIGFGIWTIANIKSNNSYLVQLGFMAILVVIWAILYFIGRLGKGLYKDELNKLNNFIDTIIGEKNKLQKSNFGA